MIRSVSRGHAWLAKFAAHANRPLEWSLVDRGLVLAALPMVAFAVISALIAHDITSRMPYDATTPPLHSAALEWTRGVVAGYAILVAWGLMLRYRSPGARFFVRVTLVYFSISTAILGAFIGPLSSPVWLSVVGLEVLGLLLLDHRDVFTAFAVFLTASVVVAAYGITGAGVYAPIYQGESGTTASRWWELRMGIVTVVNAMIILVLTAYVIQSWRAREARIRALSHHDDLTGLINRRRLVEILHTEFARAVRHGRQLSCAIVDLDHFKQINDRHGHQVGDQVLEATARTIAAQVRASDTVARYGGDEFMLVLPETPPEGARELAERCRKAIAASPARLGIHALSATASVGIAALGHAEIHRVDDLVRVTDQALYAAKEQGRNRVVVAEPRPATGVRVLNCR